MDSKTSTKGRTQVPFGVSYAASPARSMTIANLIADQVKEALFNDQLRSGDFLGTEQEIAKQYHVSRIAARDALRTLEASGIVTVRPGPGGGARIARGNPTRFAEALAIQLKLVAVTEYDIYVAQQAIEAMAVEQAARNADGADLDGLAELLGEAEGLRRDIPGFKKSCLDFHAAITEASHNQVLIALRNSIEKVLPEAYQSDPSPQHIKSILLHHRKILDQIKSGAAVAAGNQMRIHLSQMESWLGLAGAQDQTVLERTRKTPAPRKRPRR
jgi:GntR family transcriptional repressor for pyruvate dehydrogenase complex